MNKRHNRTIKDLAHKAKSGDAKAAFQLYEYHRDGLFVEQDPLLATEFAKKAIDLFRTQSLHISSLKLVDFRVFKSIDLECCHESKGDGNLTVLVGVNGAGKTTILDAIAYSLSWLILRIVRPSSSGKGATLEEQDIHRDGEGLSEYASVVLDLQLNASLQYEMELSKAKSLSNRSRKGAVKDIGRLGGLYQLANIEDSRSNMPIMAYYGVDRTIEFTKKDINKIIGDIGDTQEKFDAYDKALNARVDFVVFFKWFKYQTEVAGLETGEPQTKAKSSLKLVLKAIAGILPSLQNLRIQRAPTLDMLVDKENTTLSVDQLSQGEKSLLALVFDITRRLILLNPDDGTEVSSLDGCGIVLIDEIDLHLHPAWQQKIVPRLLKTFPNVQFILTTHSPQVITTIPSKNIKLLDNGEIFSVPKGTQGAESSRILKRIFEVDPRPQEDENTLLLNNYMDEVYDDRWEEQSVLEMRRKLDSIFGGQEPALTQADLYIENRVWEQDLEKDQ